jgi:chorismate-pyruvate lyase
MIPVRQKLVDYHNVGEALADLCGGLCGHDGTCLKCEQVDPQEIPAPLKRLLVHYDHMTTKLSEYFGRAVELEVVEHELDGDLYRRKIVLKLAGTDDVVEFGVVRIDLSYTSDAVREEILERRAPLGDILIRHNVLRRIEPRWYLRVSSGCPMFSEAIDAPTAGAFGRVGTIYCNNQPAIELLEVVTGVSEART